MKTIDVPSPRLPATGGSDDGVMSPDFRPRELWHHYADAGALRLAHSWN